MWNDSVDLRYSNVEW